MSKLYVTLLGVLLLGLVAGTEARADKKKSDDKPSERKPERKAPEPRRPEPRRPEPKPAENRRPERQPVEQRRVEQPRVEQKRVEQPRPAPAPKPAPAPRQERERPDRHERHERPQLASPPVAKPQTQPQPRPTPSSAMSNDLQRKLEQPSRNEQPARNEQSTRHLPAPRAAMKPNEDRVKPAQSNSNILGFSAGSNTRRDRDRDSDRVDHDHKRVLPKPSPVNASGHTSSSQPAIAGTQSAASIKPKADHPKAEPPKHHPKPRPIAKPDHDQGKPVVSTGIAAGLGAGAVSGAAPGAVRPSVRPDANDRRPGDQGHDHRPGDKDNDRNKPNYAATHGHQGHAVGPIARPYRTKPVIVPHDHHDDHVHRDRVVYVDRHHHHYRGSRWIFFGSTGYCRPHYYGAPYGAGFNDSYSVTVINPQPVTVYSPEYVADQEPVSLSNPTPRPPLRAVPSADAFNELPPQEQQKLMLTALNDLEGDLKESDTGDEWIDHLQLASIGKMLTERDEPLDDGGRLQIQAIADIFEDVAQEEEFKSISQLWGFNVLNVGLHVMATDPVVCQRHRVSSGATALSQAFKTWQSSDRWQSYLRLETLMNMDDAPEDLIVRIQEVDVITTKFDRIQADAQFQMIHELPAFQATHLALRAYLNDLRSIAAEL